MPKMVKTHLQGTSFEFYKIYKKMYKCIPNNGHSNVICQWNYG